MITGLSCSGKSSLAFDTNYAEGQRRYGESLASYARQFLSLMEKPDGDHIEGLSPVRGSDHADGDAEDCLDQTVDAVREAQLRGSGTFQVLSVQREHWQNHE